MAKWMPCGCLLLIITTGFILRCLDIVHNVYYNYFAPGYSLAKYMTIRPNTTFSTEDHIGSVTSEDNIVCGINISEILDRTQQQQSAGIGLKFLDDYKNPCWLERLSPDYLEQYAAGRFFRQGRNAVRTIRDIYDGRLRQSSRPWRMRCLPYFYLAGVTKSGTTDFYSALLMHSEVLGGWTKEPMYWNRSRYPNGTTVHKDTYVQHTTINEYVDCYDYSAHIINESVLESKRNLQYNHICVDGSSYLFWEDNGWTDNPGNAGLKEPMYTTPRAIAAVTPQARIIVLLRHPTDRLFSAFNMYASEMRLKDSSAEAFHQMAEECVLLTTSCFQRDGIRACAYNATLSRICHPVSLRGSLYSVFLKDWLAAFPRQQVLVVRSEDYYENRLSSLERAYRFLGTGPRPPELAKKLAERSPKNQRSYSPMLPETRTMLNNFFKPSIRELENLLQRSMW